MGIIQPDTSAALDMSAIEPGTYMAKIVAADTGVSAKGAGKVVPKFEVMVNGKARKREAHLVISGPGSGSFDQLLRACGFVELADQYKDPTFQPKPEFDTDSFVGCEVQVVIGEEIYNGEKRDRITGFLRA